MDNITTIIVTILANAVVTGIIVYLIQKRIERSYARQMEEFRANLQYSNFEQQTKFVRNQEKVMEILESLYKKMRILHAAFIHYVNLFREYTIDGNKSVEKSMEEKYDEMNISYWTLSDYFSENQLFFTQDVSKEINDIINKVTMLYDLPLFAESRSFEEWMKYCNERLKKDGLRTIKIEKEGEWLFVEELIWRIGDQKKRLERLYKLMAYGQR